MLFYNGKKKYNAPTNLWSLFTYSDIAKELMSNDYNLIDLQSMSDDEIKRKQHLGMMEFFMKHIYQRDMLKLWESFFKEFIDVLLSDKENGYIYIKKFLWYTDAKVSEDNKGQLNSLTLDNLSKEDGERIMRTIADGYIEQGIALGMEQGEARGEARGMERGLAQGIAQTALKMLQQGFDTKLISSVTGLSLDELLKLKDR